MKPSETATTSVTPSTRVIFTAHGTRAAMIGAWLARMPMSPSVVRATTLMARPSQTLPSAATTVTSRGVDIRTPS